MEVILLDKIAKLGGLGDKVTVKSGYARNFLLPQGKAVFASQANVEHFEARRAEIETKLAETLKAAEAKAAKIVALAEITIASSAGEEGKLFGSIGTKDIADAVTEFVWVDSDQYEEIRDVVDAILTDSLNYITE